MGLDMTSNTLNASSNSDLATLAVPRLCDDGSNWSDYQPRFQNMMGAKGLWRHVEGTAIMPVLYVISNSMPMLANGKTPATEDQIETKESKIVKFEKREYLARHILMSMTLTHLATEIKGMLTCGMPLKTMPCQKAPSTY
jgi:hypothetical protein